MSEVVDVQPQASLPVSEPPQTHVFTPATTRTSTGESNHIVVKTMKQRHSNNQQAGVTTRRGKEGEHKVTKKNDVQHQVMSQVAAAEWLKQQDANAGRALPARNHRLDDLEIPAGACAAFVTPGGVEQRAKQEVRAAQHARPQASGAVLGVQAQAHSTAPFTCIPPLGQPDPPPHAPASHKRARSPTPQDKESTHLNRLTVANLQDLCRASGLPTSGRKTALIERLAVAMKAK